MPRPRTGELTALGVALRRRRGGAPLHVAAREASVTLATLSRIERGTHDPSLATARRLAVWLGWSLEQVAEAAETPAIDPGAPK